jgi:hypothetical protein
LSLQAWALLRANLGLARLITLFFNKKFFLLLNLKVVVLGSCKLE